MANITIEEKEIRVKSYFQHVIMGYLMGDIETLLIQDLDLRGTGGCSAPLALIIFSAMNQLGYLTSKTDISGINQNPPTEVCIKKYFNNWMKKVDPEKYRKSTVQEIMVNFFRHGLAHQFLSVAFSGITRDPKQEQLISIKSFEGIKYYVLQVKI